MSDISETRTGMSTVKSSKVTSEDNVSSCLSEMKVCVASENIFEEEGVDVYL